MKTKQIIDRLAECRNELRKLMPIEATPERSRRVREVSDKADALCKLLTAKMKANTLTAEEADAGCGIYRECYLLQCASHSRGRTRP